MGPRYRGPIFYLFLQALILHPSLQLTFTSITPSLESNIDVALNFPKLLLENKNYGRFLWSRLRRYYHFSLALLPAFLYPNDKMPANQQGETRASPFKTFLPFPVMAPRINRATISLRQLALP